MKDASEATRSALQRFAVMKVIDETGASQEFQLEDVESISIFKRDFVTIQQYGFLFHLIDGREIWVNEDSASIDSLLKWLEEELPGSSEVWWQFVIAPVFSIEPVEFYSKEEGVYWDLKPDPVKHREKRGWDSIKDDWEIMKAWLSKVFKRKGSQEPPE